VSLAVELTLASGNRLLNIISPEAVITGFSAPAGVQKTPCNSQEDAISTIGREIEFSPCPGGFSKALSLQVLSQWLISWPSFVNHPYLKD
jgi:hypothetical protein